MNDDFESRVRDLKSRAHGHWTPLLGALGVDGLRTSHGTPNPDWPVFEPGLSTFSFGANSGTFRAELTVRSTWVIG